MHTPEDRALLEVGPLPTPLGSGRVGSTCLNLTDLARGSVVLQIYSCLPEGHPRDPRVRNYTCRILPEGLSRADTPISERMSMVCRTVIRGIADEACIIRRNPGRMKP